MSGVAKAVGKVFKGVVGIVKKIWKPLLIAVAIYFTAGAALGAMGAMAAGGSAVAGAGAGIGAAAGGIGIGTGAGITGAFAAGGAMAAGAAGAAAAGGALAAGAAGAAEAGGAAAAAGGVGAADLAGAGVLTEEAATAAGLGSAYGGAAGAAGSVLGADSVLAGTSGLAGAAGGATAAGTAAVGGASSLWGSAVNVAKQVITTPGVPSLISGVLQNYQQAKMYNDGKKWAEAHAPGQIEGGAANAWMNTSAFPANKNLTPATPTPSPDKLPMLTPYNAAAQSVPQYQVGPQPLPGANQPGPFTQYGGQWPGYGTPGYGEQFPPGQQPSNGPYPPGLLGGQSQQQPMPFIESPYDESYA